MEKIIVKKSSINHTESKIWLLIIECIWNRDLKGRQQAIQTNVNNQWLGANNVIKFRKRGDCFIIFMYVPFYPSLWILW